MWEADDKYKKMTKEEALEIVGNRATWELQNMKRALTITRALNTDEEEKRLSAVRVALKLRKVV